jgi:hypothetical protein
MDFLKNMGPEIRAAVAFALVAFVLSLLIGLISGIPVGTIFLRAAIMTPVFAAIGYGAVLVVRRFVPEIYEPVVHEKSEQKARDEQDATDIDVTVEDTPEMPEAAASEGGEPAPDVDTSGAFSEISGEDIPSVTSGANLDDSLETGTGGSDSNMGKHIVMAENMKYEPKLMAQAIRTMMNRDEK